MSKNIKNDLGLNKSYKKSFDNEKNYYANTTYNTFSSGYISNCSDSCVQRMKNNLYPLYKSIFEAYLNIDNWWNNYNNDIECLENNLTNNNSNSNGISEATVRACVSVLPELKNFKYEFKNAYQKHYSGSAIPIKNIDLGLKMQTVKKGIKLKEHYSEKATPNKNIDLDQKIYDNANTYNSPQTYENSIFSGLISILLGDDKEKNQGLFSLFQKKNQDIVDEYGLDKYGINYYDIKKYEKTATGLYVYLDNGLTFIVDLDNNVHLWDKNGFVIADFSNYSIPAGAIKDVESNGNTIKFTLKNGSEMLFSSTTFKLKGLNDSKGNYYPYSLYNLSNYNVYPCDISTIDKQGNETIIKLKDGSQIHINNDTFEVNSIKNIDGLDILSIYNKYNVSEIGAKVFDISSVAIFDDLYCVSFKNGTEVYYDIESNMLSEIVIGDIHYYFKDGHISSATVSPDIFRKENIENGQFGGNQMDFKYRSSELLKDPEIMKILKEYYPNATYEEYELLLHKLCNTGCGYIAIVNTFFQVYEGSEEDFYDVFGFPMYNVKIDGSIDYNYELVALSMFLYYWHEHEGYSLEEIIGNIDEVEIGDESQTNVKSDGATGANGWVESDCYMHFCKIRNKYISFRTCIQAPEGISNYDELIDKYNNNPDCYILIHVYDFDLYNINDDGTRGNIVMENGGNHTMEIARIENGEIIVSSWGNEYIVVLPDDKNSFSYSIISPETNHEFSGGI